MSRAADFSGVSLPVGAKLVGIKPVGAKPVEVKPVRLRYYFSQVTFRGRARGYYVM